MQTQINLLLEIWADWLHDERAVGKNIGYRGQSPEYAMMTSNAASTSKIAYRKKVYYERMGLRLARRHTEPMRCKERKRGKRVNVYDDGTVGALVDDAVAQMDEMYAKALKLKYITGFSNAASGRVMGKSERWFNNCISVAHAELLGYIKGKYGSVEALLEQGGLTR